MAIRVITLVMRLTHSPRERIWIVLRDIALFGLDAHGERRIASWSCDAGILV